MAKKLSLKDKLENLSTKKPVPSKSKPILIAKKLENIGKPKEEEKDASPIPKIPAPMPKDDLDVSTPKTEKASTAPDIDSIVSKSEINDMVSKIEQELDLDLPMAEKVQLKTIKKFEIPPTDEIKGIVGLAAVMDESGEKRLNQLLLIKDEPEAEPQWTVMRDQSAEEFAMIVKEGLRQFKTKPLVYGMEFEEGVILASHRDGFTITLACYELEIGNMIQIFISLMDYIEKNT